MGVRFAAVLGIAALVAAGCTTHSRSTTTGTTSLSSSTSQTRSTEPGKIDAGPTLTAAHLGRLPDEGIAIETPSDGVVLVALDGRTLGHLPDFQLYGNAAVPGPLLMRDTSSPIYRLDPGARSLKAMRDPSLERFPLAYGGDLVTTYPASPSTSWVERGGRVLLELGNGMNSGYTVANDRDIVTATLFTDPITHQAIDLRTGSRRTLPLPCDVTDRHGAAWYLVCLRPAEGDPDALPAENVPLAATIEVMVGSARPTRVTGAPVVAGADPGARNSWDKAWVSPDGKHLLAQWSGECESLSVYLMTITGTDVTLLAKLPGVPTGLEAGAIGWTLDGRAVVAVPPVHGCGQESNPGLFLVRPGEAPQLIHALPNPELARTIAMWQPILK